MRPSRCPVHEQANERWYQLCQLAAVEPDPEQLLELVTEVSLLLEAKESALTHVRRGTISV
jgi:hypothetical protein